MSTPNPVTAAEVSLESRISSLEARASLLETKAKTWIENNWPHFVTWSLGVLAVVKHFG